MDVLYLFYYWVTRCRGFRTLADGRFCDFFEKGGFGYGLIIAFLMAAIVAALYYLACQNFRELARRFIWAGVLLSVGVGTYVATTKYAQEGLTVCLDLYLNDGIKNGLPEPESEGASDVQDLRSTWSEMIGRPHPLIFRFGVCSAGYGMMLFLAFSSIIKDHTRYARQIPFGSGSAKKDHDV